ncbi:MAG: hypothetical protein ACFFDW_14760 [Candidatus Thorarchaeota archaeon]
MNYNNNLNVCPFCGSAIEHNQDFCHNCGANLSESTQQREFKLNNTEYTQSYQTNYPAAYTPPQTYPQYPSTTYTPTKRNSSSDSAGIIALIFGILAILGILPCIGSIIAITVGSSAKNDGSTAGQVGLILGWVSCCIPILIIVFFFAFW